MRIKILGTRGNIEPSAPRYVRHSGILVDGELLLDLGEVDYLRYKPRHIFITHLHSDHAAFTHSPVRPKAIVHVPEPTKRLPDAHVISRAVGVGSYRIVPIPTVHSHRLRSVGYRVEKEGRSFFYSSDMVTIDPYYHRRLRKLDIVITDGSYMRRGGLVRLDPESGKRYGHRGITDLVEFFRPFTRCIVIVHFGSWFYRNVEESVRKVEALGNTVRVIAGRDGMVIDV